MTLDEFFRENSRAALCFSGGVDSVYLLYAARQLGADVGAYFVKTPFQPRFELDDAKKAAALLSAELTVINYDILTDAAVVQNPPDRCYFCKRRIFSLIAESAAADGYDLLIDGTNASDDISDRPGTRAAAELAVRSPLRECGLSKDDIRALSRKAGLFTWDKPAYACLATRIPCGEEITLDKLRRTEGAEKAVAALGFSGFRIRHWGGGARLEVSEEQFMTAAQKHRELQEALKPFFDTVALDLKPRGGN